jgi:hypothetical protein
VSSLACVGPLELISQTNEAAFVLARGKDGFYGPCARLCVVVVNVRRYFGMPCALRV